MSSEILKIVRAQKKSRRAPSGWTTYYRIARKSEEGNWEYIDSRSSRKLAEKRMDEISKTYQISLIYDRSSRLISYAPTLWRSRQIIAEQIARGQSIGYFRINYSKKPDCPHYQDNQGLCHECGITLCEGTAIESGYFQKEI